MNDNYINGHIQRSREGVYQGSLTIDGVNLEGGIEATYFTQDRKNYLWLKRKKMMEYDFESQTYRTRKREPQWEAYLEKQVEGNTVAYKGTFTFLRFKYSIVGVWDRILGNDKQRLNLYVERLPMAQQTILNGINERRRKEQQ
jgi:hypothetical protein